jgi:uncharacterized protein YbcI
MPARRPTNRSEGQLALAIANMVVAVLREHTGQGPARSRTYLSDALISVVVKDTLTRAERTLVATGNTAIVNRARRALQSAMRSDLIDGVEALTGRSVIAFFGENSIDPDIALAVFLLAPEAGAH